MTVSISIFALLLLPASFIYICIIYPLYISPLSKLPVPHWSCRFFSFWILHARKNGAENASLQDAHRRLGNIVRVSPNTVSVDGVEALRTIYQGGFAKAPWYRIFDNYGWVLLSNPRCPSAHRFRVPCMFSTLGSKEHSTRKRMISNVYSKSYIMSSKPAKAQSEVIMLGRLLPALRDESAKSNPGGTEVQSLFMATTMDMISAYIFGLCNSTNFLQDKTYRDHWLDLYLSRHHHHFWPQELPFLTSLLTKIGLRPYPDFVDNANNELRTWNKTLCERATDTHFSKAEHELADTPVVFTAMHEGIDKEERKVGNGSILYDTSIKKRNASIASEILDQVLAGHETAGIVLTYAAWRLSRSPDLQKQLQLELLPHLSQNSDTLPDTKVLDALPLLNAIVLETLRLHAPIPGPQPRETPYPGCNIEGYFIPGGVRIASLAHTLHMNDTVFPNSDSWDPARWLGDDTGEKRRHFWAFGSGGRMCIGSNFALQGLRLPIIYWP